jgi:hypothetical protein
MAGPDADGWTKKMDGSKGLLDHKNAWTRGMVGCSRRIYEPKAWLATRGMAGTEGWLDQRGMAGPERDGWNRGMAGTEGWLDQRDGFAVWLSARGYSGIETKQKLCQAPSVLTAWRLTLA